MGILGEWFRDWKSPLADSARKLFVPYFDELTELKRDPEYQELRGLVVKQHA